MRVPLAMMTEDGSAMQLEVDKYKTYKRDIKFLLVSSGVWPNFQPHPRGFRVFLSAVSAFASATSFAGIVIFCLRNASNISILTRGMGLLVAFFSTFMKVCILARYEKDLQALNQGVSASFEEDLKDPLKQKHLLAHFPNFYKFFFVHNFCTLGTVITMGIIPLTMLKYGKYPRMYPQIIPLNYEPGGMIHWSIYGFEVLSGFYLWSMTCGPDCVFGLYALHMVGELRILSARYQNLTYSRNYKQTLKECVNKHLMLMDSLRILERVFGFLSIWLAITCAISLCTLVFQATQIVNVTLLRLFTLSCHVMVKFVQAYSYSWYGNRINLESQECVMSIYKAAWPGCGNSCFANDVLIVLSQKPMVFCAIGAMNLSLDVFLKIGQTSISYFFLLRTLDEKS